MKLHIYLLLGVLWLALPAHAAPPLSAEALISGIGSTFVYGLLGVFMMFICFKAVDFMTPGDLKHELMENKNMAIAVVLAGHLVAIGIIIAAAIAG